MFNNDMNFNRPLWSNGPQPGAFYNFPGASNSMKNQHEYGTQRSAYPIATGTSVIGLKYDKGVVIATDTLVSYGSMAMFRNIDRVFRINDHCILGAGADYADFQCIKKYIDEKITEDFYYDDNIEMKPKSLYNWWTRCMYNRRCRFMPWWVDLVIGGVQDGVPFLGHVDVRGRAYEDKVIATGFGKHLAVPLLREYSERPGAPDIDLPTALQLIKKCMEVLFYRDGRSYPQYKVAICSDDGTSRVEGPMNVDQNWGLATSIKGY